MAEINGGDNEGRRRGFWRVVSEGRASRDEDKAALDMDCWKRSLV